jgi:hypothetical protein
MPLPEPFRIEDYSCPGMLWVGGDNFPFPYLALNIHEALGCLIRAHLDLRAYLLYIRPTHDQAATLDMAFDLGFKVANEPLLIHIPLSSHMTYFFANAPNVLYGYLPTAA